MKKKRKAHTKEAVKEAAALALDEAESEPGLCVKLSKEAWITRQYEQWTEGQPMPDWECPERLIVTHDDLEARAQEAFGLGAEFRAALDSGALEEAGKLSLPIKRAFKWAIPWLPLKDREKEDPERPSLNQIVADSLEEKARKVEPDLRKDSRIVPSSRKLWASATITGVSTSTKATDKALAVLAGDGVGSVDVPVQADLFPSTEYRVAMLDLVDRAGLPISSQGRGVPLATRLIHTCMLATPVECRHSDVRMTMTLRDLKDAIYVNGWRRNEQMPKLLEALQSLHHCTIRLPHQWWRPVVVRAFPTLDAPLHSEIVFSIGFPPDTKDGCLIDPGALGRMGLSNSLAYRAYLAMADLNWKGGSTRIGGARKGWNSKIDAYPVFSSKDRDLIAKGPARSGQVRRKQVDAAFAALPGFVAVVDQVDKKTGKKGWRIIPREAFDKLLAKKTELLAAKVVQEAELL